MDKVAIAILNWNGKGFLEEFLPGVINYSTIDGIGVYVIDNGSTDGSVKCIQENFTSVKVIELPQNYGFTGGYNKGLKEIKADYYLILNSDVEVTQNWLNPLIELMESDSNIAACMPKIKALHKKDHFEYAGAAGGFIDKFGYPFCQGRIFSVDEKDVGQYNSIRSIFWASGACLLIRAGLFHETGGFDDDFFAHMEEIDLCWRLKNRGYKIIFNPNSVVYHLGGGTLSKTNWKKTYLNFRNNLFLLVKNLPVNKLLNILLIRCFFDFMAFCLFISELKFKDAFAIPKAYSGLIVSLPALIKKRKILAKTRKKKQHDEIYNKSIVYQFYIKRRRYFSQLSF